VSQNNSSSKREGWGPFFSTTQQASKQAKKKEKNKPKKKGRFLLQTLQKNKKGKEREKR
tara:strand:+ start:117 stop:293 length:177 start_codon:yes stop_codon:yes gene_type:complete